MVELILLEFLGLVVRKQSKNLAACEKLMEEVDKKAYYKKLKR